MRPLRLAMTALGPYKEKEMIDFTRLDPHRLFVISGNTGAGKTTIFDAICYALYDTASGEDRYETRMLRSHFADDQMPTSVEFDFAIGARSYRVARQLAYRKGNNKNETPPAAELYEITSGQAVPCVDRFNIKDINVKLQQIIGLTKDQFSQIVMLPQGEFRKLLTSDTENKEDILRRIFRTELYQKVEDRFRQLSREKKEAVERMRAELDFTVKQIASSLPMREESELTLMLQQSSRNVVQVLQALELEIKHYEQASEQAGDARKVLDAQVQQRTEAFHKSEALNERFAELDRKRAARLQMEERLPEIQQGEQRLQMAEKAAVIEPYEEQSQRSREQLEALKLKLQQKAGEVERAAMAFQDAERKLQTEQAREAERKAAELLLQRLRDMEPVVKSLHDSQAEILRLEAGEKEAAAKLAATDAALSQGVEDKRQTMERIKVLEDGADALPSKLTRLSELRALAGAMKEVQKLDVQLEEWTRQRQAAQSQFDLLQMRHDRLERLWIEGQAGMLAAHLHNGEPCPVCGSKEHPDKAAPEAELPTREQLDAEKQLLQAAREEISKAAAQAAAASTGIADKRTELGEMGGAAEDIGAAYTRVVGEGKQLKEETDALTQQAEQLKQLKAVRDQLDARINELAGSKQTLVDKLSKATLDRTLKQASLSKDLESVAEELRSYPNLTRRLQEQAKLVEDMLAVWKQVQERFAASQMNLAQEKATLAQMEQQLGEAAVHNEQAAVRFAQELRRGGFAAEADYSSAKLEEGPRATFKEQLQQFKTALSASIQAINDLELELAGKERADTASMRQQLDNLKQELEQAAALHQEAKACRQTADGFRSGIAQTSGRLTEAEHSYGEVVDVHQVMKGDNTLRMSFERYILIEFFEQILHAANARLQRLSGGQFELLRSDRIEKHNRASGLGLDVFDAYTGQNRDVKTLSGGEKFNASLCLALGMTDVIQANQGGVAIEMMFIDEGFGTLDEESLNKAIEALIDLQRMGRLIGVISHVPEIKASFPAVLEVKKSREGYSRVELLLKS